MAASRLGLESKETSVKHLLKRAEELKIKENILVDCKLAFLKKIDDLKKTHKKLSKELANEPSQASQKKEDSWGKWKKDDELDTDDAESSDDDTDYFTDTSKRDLPEEIKSQLEKIEAEIDQVNTQSNEVREALKIEWEPKKQRIKTFLSSFERFTPFQRLEIVDYLIRKTDNQSVHDMNLRAPAFTRLAIMKRQSMFRSLAERKQEEFITLTAQEREDLNQLTPDTLKEFSPDLLAVVSDTVINSDKSIFGVHETPELLYNILRYFSQCELIADNINLLHLNKYAADNRKPAIDDFKSMGARVDAANKAFQTILPIKDKLVSIKNELKPGSRITPELKDKLIEILKTAPQKTAGNMDMLAPVVDEACLVLGPLLNDIYSHLLETDQLYDVLINTPDELLTTLSTTCSSSIKMLLCYLATGIHDKKALNTLVILGAKRLEQLEAIECTHSTSVLERIDIKRERIRLLIQISQVYRRLTDTSLTSLGRINLSSITDLKYQQRVYGNSLTQHVSSTETERLSQNIEEIKSMLAHSVVPFTVDGIPLPQGLYHSPTMINLNACKLAAGFLLTISSIENIYQDLGWLIKRIINMPIEDPHQINVNLDTSEAGIVVLQVNLSHLAQLAHMTPENPESRSLACELSKRFSAIERDPANMLEAWFEFADKQLNIHIKFSVFQQFSSIIQVQISELMESAGLKSKDCRGIIFQYLPKFSLLSANKLGQAREIVQADVAAEPSLTRC